jgi:hypothetical protein
MLSGAMTILEACLPANSAGLGGLISPAHETMAKARIKQIPERVMGEILAIATG